MGTQKVDPPKREMEIHTVKVVEETLHVSIPVLDEKKIQKDLEAIAEKILAKAIENMMPALQKKMEEVIESIPVEKFIVPNRVNMDFIVPISKPTDFIQKRDIPMDVPLLNWVKTDVWDLVKVRKEIPELVPVNTPFPVLVPTEVQQIVLKEKQEIVERPLYVDKEVINPILRDQVIKIKKLILEDGTEVLK